jgi:predicted RNase H-like HicB family nuclease
MIEEAENHYPGYLAVLPGCVATGDTPDQVLQRIAKASDMHIAGLEEDGLPNPKPTSKAE